MLMLAGLVGCAAPHAHAPGPPGTGVELRVTDYRSGKVLPPVSDGPRRDRFLATIAGAEAGGSPTPRPRFQIAYGFRATAPDGSLIEGEADIPRGDGLAWVRLADGRILRVALPWE